MTAENLIKEILRLNPKMTKEQLQEMIKAKVEESKGFLTVESATRAVAVDLHVKSLKIPFMDKITIKDLISGLGDVTIIARIIFVGSLKKFITPEETEGRFKTLIVADKTGNLKVILWGNNADVAESLNLLGQTAQFLHGYVRQGRNGKLELNLGSKGSIRLVQDDLQKTEIPPLSYFHKKIDEITKEIKKVNVIGIVSKISAASSFIREDGSEGKMKKLDLADETGVISVVFWDVKDLDLKDIRTGSIIQLFGAKVKNNLCNGIELHVDSSVNLSVLREMPF